MDYLYNFICLGNIIFVKDSYYSISYIMYNEIKYKLKGECIMLITIITGIFYIDFRVVISFVLCLNFGNVCNLY